MRFPTSLLYHWILIRKDRNKRPQGFTLLELLISLVVSSLVVTGLLSMVVELTAIDKREASLDQVQRDMQRAMDYISDDLQEAVYVYTDPERIADELDADPAFPDDAGDVPVLAFWRVDPIEENLPDCTSGDDTFNNLCDVLTIRQSAYTLVVYSQRQDDDNENWDGQSRIIRYELSKYSDLATLTVRDGYRDPTNSLDEDAPFEAWLANGTPAGTSAVLTDFVKDPSDPFNRDPLAASATASCGGLGDDADGNSLYTVLPEDATTTNNTSFFACIRNPDPDNDPDTSTRTNQDIYLFLRGSTAGASGGTRSLSEQSSLPILETQVLVKGVIDKALQD